jgi:hypothetical protein
MRLNLIVVLLALAGSARAQKHKIVAEFPAEMSDAVRAEYQKQWDKGRILWDMNCARCHNTQERRKVIIPDFKPEQLIGYELRVKNAQHDTGIAEERVSTEELGLIMTFLSYKKKNK